ncbi:hypothetical protein DICPUDRAFT_155018 [Dictyostelium purpureum]|uniref:Uncharacterized protein n=1 Tax=Dictyostelium purpureum TaxID=5786 RepID=F0ZSV1_DICPU|nr:uncharacterized protein DICPUDRAFT_155018 [Dictyostelium purpureum]EGC32972.1 hypothetical protein DICPUDRAFT_155018 [Dictyostelium purpureum]|eukprot:XP_003290490.1 hypothetical protein DICPUDRAFT_155018 [Dictyostelium purpureum]
MTTPATTTTTPTPIPSNIPALDLYTFLNLTSDLVDTKYVFKCKLSNEVDGIYITNAWVAGFVKSSRVVRKKVAEGEDETSTLELMISDGCSDLRVVQYKTPYKAEDFEISQYYSFIVRPFMNKPGVGTVTFTQIQASLSSFHKITNYNEVTAHISESIRSFYYMLAPFPSLVIKVIKAYTSNGYGIKENILIEHLQIKPEEDKKISDLKHFIKFLKDNNQLIENENGYTLAEQQS